MQSSTKAIAQLATITPMSGTCLKRRCPYHANVMNRLEPMSSRIGREGAETSVASMGGTGKRKVEAPNLIWASHRRVPEGANRCRQCSARGGEHVASAARL